MILMMLEKVMAKWTMKMTTLMVTETHISMSVFPVALVARERSGLGFLPLTWNGQTFPEMIALEKGLIICRCTDHDLGLVLNAVMSPRFLPRCLLCHNHPNCPLLS